MKIYVNQMFVPADCLACDDWHHMFWSEVRIWHHRNLSVAECRTCGATWSWLRPRFGFTSSQIRTPKSVRFVRCAADRNVRRAA